MTRAAIGGWFARLAPVGLVLVAAAIWGLGLRLVSPEAQGGARAAAAWLPVFGAALVLSACAVRCAPRWRAVTVTGAFGAAVTATLCAGAPLVGALTSGLVAAAAAALAMGLAAALRRLAVAAPSAALGGLALPALLAGAIFVADPFVEWGGSTPTSRAVARWVLRVNPIAAATSVHDGLGVDWQTMPLLYDGAEPGSEGLSVIGQYYPARAPSPIWWSIWASAGAALLLLAAGAGPPAGRGLARTSHQVAARSSRNAGAS